MSGQLSFTPLFGQLSVTPPYTSPSANKSSDRGNTGRIYCAVPSHRNRAPALRQGSGCPDRSSGAGYLPPAHRRNV
jgi:hypothetical protein